MEMVDSMSQKNVDVNNKNRWEMMKYNNTIKFGDLCLQTVI